MPFPLAGLRSRPDVWSSPSFMASFLIRQVLTLRFGLANGEPLTIKGVGVALDLPYDSTKQLLYRAMTKMRRPHIVRALRDYAMLDDDDGCVIM